MFSISVGTIKLLIISSGIFGKSISEKVYLSRRKTSDGVGDAKEDRIRYLMSKFRAEFGSGRYSDAKKLYDEVVRLDPSKIDLLEDRGRAEYSKRQYDRAVRYFQMYLEYRPYDIRLLFLVSNIEDRVYKKPERAIELLDKLVSIDGSHSKAWLTLGILERKRSEFEEAYRCFDMVVYLSEQGSVTENSTLEKALRELYFLELIRHNYSESRKLTDKLLQLNPNDRRTLIQRVILEFEDRRYRDGDRFLAEAIKHFTDKPGIIGLAPEFTEELVRSNSKISRRARQVVDAMCKHSMYQDIAYAVLARLEAKTGNRELAIDIIKRSLEKDPDNLILEAELRRYEGKQQSEDRVDRTNEYLS